jgi:hypothetical protein
MKNEPEAIRENAPKRRRTPTAKQPAPPKLKLLITVVNREKADLYSTLIQSFEVNMQMIVAAEGTANKEMLRYLGLTDNKKAVILSIIREDQAEAAMRFLEDKFNTVKHGKGIAYTVPMTGTIGVAIYQFLSNSQR